MLAQDTITTGLTGLASIGRRSRQIRNVCTCSWLDELLQPTCNPFQPESASRACAKSADLPALRSHALQAWFWHARILETMLLVRGLN